MNGTIRRAFSYLGRTATAGADYVWRLSLPAGESGPMVRFDPTLDAFRAYVTDNLKPSTLRALLRAADSGDLATTLQLFSEMEQKDTHLRGVANTRRAALTGLEWEIASAAESMEEGEDRTLADEAADFVRQSLRKLDAFEEGLEWLAKAIGPNLAVLELVWDSGELVDLVPIPNHRLTMDPMQSLDVRIVTTAERRGIVASAPKFVVHIPEACAGLPFECGIAQSQAMIYLIKFMAIADWGHFCELFGMPVRFATYRSAATAAEKTEAINSLKNMGSAAYALFSDAFNFQIAESTQRGVAPYEALVNWCERKQSIAFLGQHMTTDTSGSTGTMATASVQDRVRRDLMEDDVRKESRTVRRQIIAPMCATAFPGRDVPLPIFRRKFREQIDRQAEANLIATAQRAGVRVPQPWAYERLGIPELGEDEKALEPGLDAFGENVREMIPAETP